MPHVAICNIGCKMGTIDCEVGGIDFEAMLGVRPQTVPASSRCRWLGGFRCRQTGISWSNTPARFGSVRSGVGVRRSTDSVGTGRLARRAALPPESSSKTRATASLPSSCNAQAALHEPQGVGCAILAELVGHCAPNCAVLRTLLATVQPQSGRRSASARWQQVLPPPEVSQRFAFTNDCVGVAVHQHLGRTGPGVVVGGHREAIGPCAKHRQ